MFDDFEQNLQGKLNYKLICTILNNPTPVEYNVTCIADTPKIELDPPTLAFGRVLLGCRTTKVVVIKYFSSRPGYSCSQCCACCLAVELRRITSVQRVEEELHETFQLSPYASCVLCLSRLRWNIIVKSSLCFRTRLAEYFWKGHKPSGSDSPVVQSGLELCSIICKLYCLSFKFISSKGL